jgi:hypothetical protein
MFIFILSHIIFLLFYLFIFIFYFYFYFIFVVCYNSIMPASSWKDIQTRRKFFEMYAKRNGFDPLNPENWYSQIQNKIISQVQK